jgi:hypothetical protein
MPIQSGDVKLLKSAVMADVPEGGGAPTGNVIPDGVSNAIFPDISELDRAGGRVNLRKTFVSIQTDDTDLYFGGNVIVADPPEDPRVSVTLFSSGQTFDNRDAARTRIEAYLNKGPEWGGYLYENHIQGQRVVQLLQRVNSELPNAGQTLVLSQGEGTPSFKEQYVRATNVSAVEQTFTVVVNGTFLDYKAWVVTVEISDALRFDFTGTPANRTFSRDPAATRVRDTVVADAGTYVGVVPLTAPAALGAFTVSGDSIYTQLVPSAQTETPIVDVRTNGVSFALVPTGGPLTQTFTLGFTTSQNLFVGGAVYPGSLTVVRGGVTVTDDGGTLVNGGTQVGIVDYENGILQLTSNVFGTTSGTHTVTFTPAEVPELISKQAMIPVTPESRSISYVTTLGTLPVRNSLSVSYLAQGRWYVLRDNGTGVVRGLDSAFGAGTVNYTTGSLVLTLGALPDVGSAIVITYFADVDTAPLSNTLLLNDGRFAFVFNSDGVASEEPGSKAITPGSLVVAWDHGGSKTATDNGLGVLSGDASGTVDYSNGVIRLSPTVLPPPGTVFSAALNGTNVVLNDNSFSFPVGTLGATNIRQGSVQIQVDIEVIYSWTAFGGFAPGAASRFAPVTIYDRNGDLFFRDPGGGGAEIACGTIDYATGDFVVTAPGLVADFDLSGPILRRQDSPDTGASTGTQFTMPAAISATAGRMG